MTPSPHPAANLNEAASPGGPELAADAAEQQAIAEAARAADALAEAGLPDAVGAALADDIPAETTLVAGDRAALERVVARRRARKAELQKILAVARAKIRQHTETIRGLEDHLDRLAESGE
jgi:hypothetical protein